MTTIIITKRPFSDKINMLYYKSFNDNIGCCKYNAFSDYTNVIIKKCFSDNINCHKYYVFSDNIICCY